MGGRVKETERGKLALLRRLAHPGSGLVEVAGVWHVVMPDGRKGAPVRAAAGQVDELRADGLLLCDSEGRLTLSPAGRRRLAVAAGRSDPFRRQHQHVVARRMADPAGATVRLAADAAESPLAWLYTRKDRDGLSLITEAQYRAGLRLHADFIRSGLTPRLTTNWDASLAQAPGVNGGSLTPGEQALAARQRYRRALAGVGPELSRILVEVCCLGTGIETAERVLGLPRRSGKVVLQLALSSLARCYGLLGDEDRSAAGALRGWGMEGFRPAIAPGSGPS